MPNYPIDHIQSNREALTVSDLGEALDFVAHTWRQLNRHPFDTDYGTNVMQETFRLLSTLSTSEAWARFVAPLADTHLLDESVRESQLHAEDEVLREAIAESHVDRSGVQGR